MQFILYQGRLAHLGFATSTCPVAYLSDYTESQWAGHPFRVQIVGDSVLAMETPSPCACSLRTVGALELVTASGALNCSVFYPRTLALSRHT